MTLLTPASPTTIPTTAALQAAGYFETNLAALHVTQPNLAIALRDVTTDVTWLFARDGSLHAMDAAQEKWFAGCSLPLLAGRAVLESLEPNPLMSCYLAPAHAGLLRAAREKTGDDPALLAIAPNLETLRVILACHDFSLEIASHHLWFAAGTDWPAELRNIFDENPGLPTPGRFIRSKLVTDEIADPMIRDAQQVFSTVLTERAQRLESIRMVSATMPTRDSNRVLLIAGSSFRLWDDAGESLARELTARAADDGLTIERFDSDDPASSSPLALATAATRCGHVAAANITRGDAANLVPLDTPWVTWITRPNIPPFSSVGPTDSLVVADPKWITTAMTAGWPAERVIAAPWPRATLPSAATAGRSLAIIANTVPIVIPRSIEDLSSHRVLWDNIAAELHDDPLAVEDPNRYLDDRAARLDITAEALDRLRFIDALVLPAYEQGIARLLLTAGLPLRVHGRGWDQLDEFRAVGAGPVPTRAALLTAASAASALVYIWPIRFSHPIEALGRPVVHRPGRRRESLIREATVALNSTSAGAPPPTASLGETVVGSIRRQRG